MGINANNFNNIVGKEPDYNSEKIKKFFKEKIMIFQLLYV